MGQRRSRRPTPASGFIGPVGALIIGGTAGIVCQYAVNAIKQRFHIDDSLDVFAVHGVGGILGTLYTALLALDAFGGRGYVKEGMTFGSQLGVQALGIAATVAWTLVATFVIVKVTAALVGLRVSKDDEIEGLDLSAHGERAYDQL